MLKKRLIFQLLTDGENFYLSRNFRLNRIGDLQWLIRNLQLNQLVDAVDELSIVNVSARPPLQLKELIKDIQARCFVPISVTGGIRSMQDIEQVMDLGVEKVGISTAYLDSKDILAQASKVFGRQAVLLHIDYRMNEKGVRTVFFDSGRREFSALNSLLQDLDEEYFGELVLHSITHEGTSTGFDVGVLETCKIEIQTPLTLSGGAGKLQHFERGLSHADITGLATANLLNFVKGGMERIRLDLLTRGAPLAQITSSKWTETSLKN